MRVLMLNKDAVPGGTSRHVSDLSAGLAALGCTVEVVMPDGGHAQETDRISGCRVLRPRSLGRALSTELAPGAAWTAMTRAADIVHLHLPNPVGAAALLLVPRRPLVVSFQCELSRDFGWPARAYGAITNRVMARADRVVLSSEAMRESASVRTFGDRIDVVPLGIDPARWPVASPERIARAAPWPRPFVLYLGRLAYYKGLDVLLEAARGLAFPVVLAGDGPERATLESRARSLGLGDRVRFLGHVPDEDLPALVAAARCVVLPSTTEAEAFGQTIVEGALAGRPTVATTLPTGVPWVNLHEVTGLNVPPGDATALAAALRRLCEDEALAERLGAAARERALREFTSPRMAERMLALYGRVLAERKQTGAAHAIGT